MMTLHPTKAQGATARPAPGLYVDPAAIAPETPVIAGLEDSGINAPFVFDLLSAALTHERCGCHLYRSVRRRSVNPVLQARYQEFGTQTERHVAVLEELVTELGGNPCYVSASARSVEAMNSQLLESTFLTAGTLDLMSQELAMLDAVLLAETIDHANWSTLGQLVESFPDGSARFALARAVEQVEDEEDEHLEWAQLARARIVLFEATAGPVDQLGRRAEELIARIRLWLS
jgi:hypothetical protein